MNDLTKSEIQVITQFEKYICHRIEKTRFDKKLKQEIIPEIIKIVFSSPHAPLDKYYGYKYFEYRITTKKFSTLLRFYQDGIICDRTRKGNAKITRLSFIDYIRWYKWKCNIPDFSIRIQSAMFRLIL